MDPMTFGLFAVSGVIFLLYMQRRRSRLARDTEYE